ncbi:MAG TPA: PIG-L family deacetylase [Bryobacteraceae bacterium]|nr:PIG-L family deacetylase [Bryobacteraceae bacterium]
MRILAIHAHPDDIESLAAGTLALLAERGHDITIATMTPGDCGSAEHSPEEISAIRRGEATRAAALIGAAYLCVESRDLAVFNDDATRRTVTEILRRTRPELVLAPSPADYMCDHEAASVLVRDACFGAPAPNYNTRAASPAPPLRAIPHLYWMDPIGGVDRDDRLVAPDFVVDVGKTQAIKREMLACHASQRAWLMKHHGLDDYVENMDRTTALRGKLVNVAYGEGFRLYKGHPYPQTPLLEQALGGELVHVYGAVEK